MEAPFTVHDAGNGWDAEEQFSLRSPCSLVRVRSIANGNVLTVVDTFVLADDGLHIALPPVAGGVRRDDMFTVCAKDRVYTFDARTNRCVEWDPAMNGVSGTQRDSCGIDRGVVVDTFTIRPLGGGVPIRMDIRDGALLSPTLTGQVAEPQPSFEDAVRRADEIVKQGESRGRAQ